MPKPDPDFEPDYDMADMEYDEGGQDREHEVVDLDYELGADPDYEEEPQADYEPGADPDYDEAPQLELVAPTPAPVHLVAEASAFAFEIGRPVLPPSQPQPQLIVWRGHLKEPHPVTGLLHRVPVYRLADGYWDCYREEELQVA